MSAMKRKGTFYIYVPKQVGEAVQRSTQTKDAKVCRGMQRLVADLKDSRRWTLLNAVVDGRVSLGELYDAHTANALPALEANLSALALHNLVPGYLQWCRARGLAPRNVDNIDRQLTAFLAWLKAGGYKGTTADLTSPIVSAWVAGLTSSTGTRRQYLYAVTGFTRHLCDIDVVKDYPLSRVRAPKKNAPRTRYEDAETDERIVLAASPQYRGLFAFVKATGADLSTAINTIARDIEIDRRVARLHGTKTPQRDVHQAMVEEWAWKHLLPDLRASLPYAKPWGHLTRHGAHRHHERCCAALGIENYTLRDSRHSIAVRMAKQNYTLQEIAGQLGNSVALVATVYARYIPILQHKTPVTPLSATGDANG